MTADSRRTQGPPGHGSDLIARRRDARQRDAVFFAYDTRDTAEEAIRALGQSGFDLDKRSLIGKGCHSEEKPMGFYPAGARIESCGASGALRGGIRSLLLVPARGASGTAISPNRPHGGQEIE